jgi:hypothetical protein
MKANRLFALAVAASMLAVLALPATAGTTQISGMGVFDDTCLPPNGSPPANPGDYPPIKLSGDLFGCWYTYISSAKFNRSGTYQETGTETFIGCMVNRGCGTFTTTYTFTGKFDDTGAEIHGRCHHPLASGADGFAGAKGLINFKDDVVNLRFDYRGHITFE